MIPIRRHPNGPIPASIPVQNFKIFLALDVNKTQALILLAPAAGHAGRIRPRGGAPSEQAAAEAAAPVNEPRQ
jgi:hypothetical protein